MLSLSSHGLVDKSFDYSLGDCMSGENFFSSPQWSNRPNQWKEQERKSQLHESMLHNDVWENIQHAEHSNAMNSISLNGDSIH